MKRLDMLVMLAAVCTIIVVFSTIAMALLPSCCPPIPTPGGSRSQRRVSVKQEYGELSLSGARLRDHSITVNGSTDLPFGSTIVVTIQPLENLDMAWDHSIKVMKNPFSVNIPVPGLEYYSGADFLVQAIFSPADQSRAIQDQVGRNGEHLVGILSIMENGDQSLQSSIILDWFDITGEF